MAILASALTISAEIVSSKPHLESYLILLIRTKDRSNTQHDPMQTGQFLCHHSVGIVKTPAIWEHFP